VFQELTINANGSGSTYAVIANRSGSTQTEATARFCSRESERDFPDAILWELLKAQTAWLATHDSVILRRRLISLLAMLG